MKYIQVDSYTVHALGCIFRATRGKSYYEVMDAAVEVYLQVLKGRIHPAAVVQGFYSVIAVIFNLSARQFACLQRQF